MTSGLSLKGYALVAEREGKDLVELGPDEPMAAGDLIYWKGGKTRLGQVQTDDRGWATIEPGSPLVGTTKGKDVNIAWRMR